MMAAPMARSNGSTTICPRRPSTRCASGCGGSWPTLRVAAGALERPIVFAGNDTPGVMMASAMRTYIARYAATPAKRIALFTNNEMAGARSRLPLGAGLQIAAVIDARPDVSAAHRSLAAKAVYCAAWLRQRRRRRQGWRQENCRLADRRCARRSRGRRSCRLRRWNPAVGLTSYHRGRPKWRDDIAAFVPDGAPPGMVAAGAANGDFGLDACSARDLPRAAAARDAGHNGKAGTAPIADDEAFSLTPLWHVAGKGKAFVDYQHDVTASDIELAQREGFESVEHLKRYNDLGMATDHGKTSNVAGLAIMAAVSGRSNSRDRHDDLPPPYVPGRHRRLRRPSSRRDFPCDAADAVASLAVNKALSSSTPACGSARNGIRAPARRTGWNRDPRGQGGTRRCRLLRCLDARQDRRARPDAGTFLDRVYINTFSNLAWARPATG